MISKCFPWINYCLWISAFIMIWSQIKPQVEQKCATMITILDVWKWDQKYYESDYCCVNLQTDYFLHYSVNKVTKHKQIWIQAIRIYMGMSRDRQSLISIYCHIYIFILLHCKYVLNFRVILYGTNIGTDWLIDWLAHSLACVAIKSS